MDIVAETPRRIYFEFHLELTYKSTARCWFYQKQLTTALKIQHDRPDDGFTMTNRFEDHGFFRIGMLADSLHSGIYLPVRIVVCNLHPGDGAGASFA